MEKYDIIRVAREEGFTSEEYIVLSVHDNNRPAKIVNLKLWERHHDDPVKLIFGSLDMSKEEVYPWKVTGKFNAEEINHPYYKVIRKIRFMNAKRKEQGYAF